MKKLMIGLVGACALAMSAGAEVASENIVGYNDVTLEKNKFKMIAVQFEDVVTADTKISLQKLLSLNNIPAVTYDETGTAGVELQVLQPTGGYARYYYINDALDDEGNELEGNYWVDFDGIAIPDSDLQTLGKGFWMITRSLIDDSKPASVSLSGAVCKETTMTIPFKQGFTIVANPFPEDVSLNNVTLQGIAAVSYDDVASGVELQVMSETGGYVRYYYINDAYDSDDNEVDGNCWADFDGIMSEGNEIKVGLSFWVSAPSEGTLTFSR